MKKIGFMGAFDKSNFIIYAAKVLNLLDYKVLVVDTTSIQKMKYIIPSINPTKSYITSFENIDFAIGFENWTEVERYLGIQYDTNDHSYYWKHIENPFARKYNTIIVDNTLCVTPDDFVNLTQDIQELKKSDPEMKIRVIYQITVENDEASVNFSEFRNIVSSMRNVKVDVKDFVKKRNKEKQKERVAISSGRYSYILDHPLEIKSNIHEYLLREKNIDLPLETIDAIIGKYIPK